jgi:hypothetical protein
VGEANSVGDKPYRDKVTELLGLLDEPHVPPGIKDAVPRLSEAHNKLFVMVGEPCPATRADYLRPGLYPSNLLCELVEAIRALEWPRVISLVEEAVGHG